ncbi:FecCD family ABC transporter permease [Corynebacterium aquilae]|uniref:FecCD family ABC transporter permease n=1 Tax=Corynebacterium aquilae TaxID=203263 RepID=UPI0009524981|nr:iron ABC transporter permease [Corynebacterium aquilae]
MHASARILAAAALCLIAATASITIGARTLVEVPSPGALWQALVHPVAGDTLSAVVHSRIPRTVNALIAGVALAVAGAGIQGLTRNALAEPGLLGINAGASLFVVAGLTVLGSLTLPAAAVLAFCGACVATGLVYVLAGRGQASPLSLILVGAAIMAGTSSLVSALVLSSNQTLDTFRSWQIGNINRSDTSQAVYVVPVLVVGVALVWLHARALNAFAMGRDMAQALGIHTTRAAALVLLGVAVLSAASVALVGPLMFVGLVVPHLARALVGGDYQLIIAFCVFAGPALLLVADVVGRVVAAPAEIPVGVMLAFVGAPYFLYVLRSSRRVLAS